MMDLIEGSHATCFGAERLRPAARRRPPSARFVLEGNFARPTNKLAQLPEVPHTPRGLIKITT